MLPHALGKVELEVPETATAPSSRCKAPRCRRIDCSDHRQGDRGEAGLGVTRPLDEVYAAILIDSIRSTPHVNAAAARSAIEGLTERWGTKYAVIIVHLCENAWDEFIPFLGNARRTAEHGRRESQAVGHTAASY